MWDSFAETNNIHQFSEHSCISIRKFAYYSYRRLRVFYSVIDCLAMDWPSKQYDMKELALAVLFLVIGG